MGLTAGVFASTFGERLSAVGVSGVPDEYEQPRWDLNAKISKTFDKWSVLNELHSTKGIGRAVSRYAEHDLELLQIIPTLGIEECSNFTMYNWVELVVHDRTENKDLTIKVVGGIIIKAGAAKVANYRS